MSTHLQAVQALFSSYYLLFTILDLEGEDLLEGPGLAFHEEVFFGEEIVEGGAEVFVFGCHNLSMHQIWCGVQRGGRSGTWIAGNRIHKKACGWKQFHTRS